MAYYFLSPLLALSTHIKQFSPCELLYSSNSSIVHSSEATPQPEVCSLRPLAWALTHDVNGFTRDSESEVGGSVRNHDKEGILWAASCQNGTRARRCLRGDTRRGTRAA
jgi:hypothetical protein